VVAVGSNLRKHATGEQTAHVDESVSAVGNRSAEPLDLLSSLERDSFRIEASDGKEEMHEDETQAIERFCAARPYLSSSNNKEDNFSVDLQDYA